MRPWCLPLLAGSLLGCAGRFMPAPPPPMVPPTPSCRVASTFELELPPPAHASGRVALLRPLGPDAQADAMWGALDQFLRDVGYDVSPYAEAERAEIACDDEGRCDLSALGDTLGRPPAFDWVVTASLATAPARSTLRAIAIDDGGATLVQRFEMIVNDGDLIAPVAAPRALAVAMAERDDPRPPPESGELAYLECVHTDHEAPHCPEYRRPTGDDVLLLARLHPDQPRLVWHDADLEISLPLTTVQRLLADASHDDWDERRGEWATDRLRHLQRMVGQGESPWLSSMLQNGDRDGRMDALVRTALLEGTAEIHRCQGPLVDFVQVTVAPTDDGERTELHLPDGSPLLLPPADDDC